MEYEELKARIKAVSAERKTRAIRNTIREPERKFDFTGDRQDIERQRVEYHKACAEYYRQLREYEAEYSSENATRLYSAAAHLRKRLHMKKQWVPCVEHQHKPTLPCPTDGRRLVEYTLDDQAKLVENLLK